MCVHFVPETYPVEHTVLRKGCFYKEICGKDASKKRQVCFWALVSQNFCVILDYMLFSIRSANIADKDKLCLSESHFYNLHLLSPYYSRMVLQRLCDTYCTPLEMENDVSFFIKCTVSIPFVCPNMLGVRYKSSTYFMLFPSNWNRQWSRSSSNVALLLSFCHYLLSQCTIYWNNFSHHTITLLGLELWRTCSRPF